VFFRQRNKIKKEKHRAETALDELKRAQQKLVEKEKLAAIGSLAQRMAHEIQNPLNFVNNFSELSEGLTAELANAKTDEERQEIISTMKENMSKINHHGKRADGIIKKLQQHLNEGKRLDLLEI
jgi:C4-dicarboxylate-specific signal transduction histidine kinase